MIDVATNPEGPDFTSIGPGTRAELEQVIDLADRLKTARAAGEPTDVLPRRSRF